jgi:DNA-binding transcriptional ArsR family regulator
VAAGEDDVFKALADPTRRALLDSLRDTGGQTVGSLCAQFPTMTRFGVMKHLGVLEAANLVVTHRDGRTKLHHLNPVPIQEIANRWTQKFSAPITHALLGLRDELERPTA